MQAAIGFFLSRWSLSFVGTALLAALAWWFGPLLPPLEDALPRGGVVVALLLVWAGLNVRLDRQRRARDAALTSGITAGSEEVAALAERLNQALQQLKAARGTRGYIYEQPWYAIIGPPGAGKTTALLNAGLTFPLVSKTETGAASISGVGGTRLCDWWFTDTAVLIDTAGRYTTQDSDAEVDRAGWEGFLDLLKRTRARQPLNGVIVGIALSDIALASPPERLAHARAIRQRVKELDSRLGVRLPVYALFTKADLIAGFSEFFGDLDGDTRGQVWGTTFAGTDDPAGPVGGFADAFAGLVTRLNGRLFARLQAEHSADRRALIAGFPAQVASLAAPLGEFLAEAFGGSKLDRAPFLRGVYLTSGTQEGTPFDRLTGTLARAFGLDQRHADTIRPVRGRSYFLRQLLRDVIFQEAMLVAEPPAARRRRQILRGAAFGLVGLLAVAAGGWVWRAGEGERADIAAVAIALQAYEHEARNARLDPVNDADLPAITPLLDRARTLPYGDGTAGSPGTLIWAPGLGQDGKLTITTSALYRHALERVLLPRLIWRLEAQMRGAMTQPDFLYEATRVYLMLGGGGPLDRDLVHVWMRLDWEATFPDAALRDALLRHLDALLAEPLPPVSLDGALVAAARATFGRVSFVQRVYSRIPPSAAAQKLAPWKPRDALGAAGATLFTRASGKSLDDGIPGLYTVAGFHQVLLPALGRAASDVAAESWVLGQTVTIDPTGPEMQTLQTGVIALYEADFFRLWDAMLADLDVIPARSLAQAAQGFYILGSPESPMRDLLVSIARQLTLSVPPAPSLLDHATNAISQAAREDAARLGGVFRSTMPAQAADRPPGWEVDARYKALRDLVGTGPGAPIDQVLKSLNDLQQQLAKLAVLPPGAAAPPVGPDDPAVVLRMAAEKQPLPFGRWLTAMATSGATLRSGGAKQQTISVYNSANGPGPNCARTINGHFPFVAAATTDAGLEDFGRLFARGGWLDGFFNTQLRPYVAISSRGWRPQAVDGVPAPLSQADLDQFQRVGAIRELFFTGGSEVPSLRFDITPLGIDKAAAKVILDFDGIAVTYPDGAAKATTIAWPGPTKMLTVKLAWDAAPSITETGPWALLRMFAHGKIQPGAAGNKFVLAFSAGEREASFEIHTASANNPFTTTALRDFRCPTVQ